MHRHRLSRADIRALAAGSLSMELVQRLCDAELSRHLLLIEAVRRKAAGGGSPGLPSAQADVFAETMAELIRRERISPTSVRKVAGLPQIGAWASQCLAAFAAGRQVDLGYLAELLKRADRANMTRGRRLRVRHAGVTLNVVLDHSDPYLDLYGPRTDVLSTEDVAAWRDRLAGAWRSIVRHDRRLAWAIAYALKTIVPLKSAADGRPRSATSGWAFGAIALSFSSDETWCADSLVHEFRHLLLSAAADHRPLSLTVNGSLEYAPWRDDPRPLSGLLVGSHAYLGLLEFWRRQAAGDRTAERKFTRWVGPVTEAIERLAASDTLTKEGSLLVAAMRARLAEWRSTDRPAATYRLAEDAAADHRIRWRLRHLRLDELALDALADAWSSGTSPVMVPAYVTGSPLRGPVPATRSRSLETACDGRAIPTASTLDVAGRAVLDGRYDAAAEIYKAQIGARHDPDAWAGLSLCRARSNPRSALARRPEVVAGLHERLRRRPGGLIDPDLLGAWLDGDQVIIGSTSSATRPR